MSPSLSPSPITTPPIRIAVLEADIKFTKYGGYRGLYNSLLQAAADSLGWPRDRLEISAWDVVNWKEGQLRGYPDLGEVDAVLISGSGEYFSDLHDCILKGGEKYVRIFNF